jgi:hypothetical protein
MGQLYLFMVFTVKFLAGNPKYKAEIRRPKRRWVQNDTVVPVLNETPHEPMVSWAKTLHILSLSSGWRQVVSFSLRPLYHWERAPVSTRYEGWVGPSAGLESVKGRKISAPGGE